MVQGQIGPEFGSDGAVMDIRLGRDGDQIVSTLHGRYYEQAVRGRLFSTGSGLTALSANTITLTATTTPIVGIWNPPTSGVNCVMLQSGLVDVINNTTSVGAGAFVWASSTGNSAITTGSNPFNRKTMTLSGSTVRAFSGGVALTGLTNSLVVFGSADFNTSSALLTTAAPATSLTPGALGTHLFDGDLIVPPGGVLALLNTVSSVTHSVWSRLLWEEVLI